MADQPDLLAGIRSVWTCREVRAGLCVCASSSTRSPPETGKEMGYFFPSLGHQQQSFLFFLVILEKNREAFLFQSIPFCAGAGGSVSWWVCS